MRPVSSHPRGIFGGGGSDDSVFARSLSLPFSAVKGADDEDNDEDEDADANADALLLWPAWFFCRCALIAAAVASISAMGGSAKAASSAH